MWSGTHLGGIMKTSPSTRSESRITLRAVLLGFILMPVNAYWIAMVEMVWHGFHFSATSIPMNVIFIVFTLALVNAGVHRFFPNYALTQAELLVIYIMMATTTSVIAHDNMVSLMGPLTHAFSIPISRSGWSWNTPRWHVHFTKVVRTSSPMVICVTG